MTCDSRLQIVLKNNNLFSNTTFFPPESYIYNIHFFFSSSDNVEAVDCQFHPSYLGTWFSREGGVDVQTTVSPKKWGSYKCLESHVHLSDNDANAGVNTTFLINEAEKSVLIPFDLPRK